MLTRGSEERGVNSEARDRGLGTKQTRFTVFGEGTKKNKKEDRNK